MSKEFEELVLKKLDNLGTEVSGLSIKVEANTKKLDKLESNVSNLQTEVNGFKTEVNSLKTEVNSLKTEVNGLKTQVGNLSIEVKETGDVVQYLNQNFTKFDFEINQKIDTLFDAYTKHEDKNSFQDQGIDSLNAKVFNHDIRISNLEEKVLIA